MDNIIDSVTSFIDLNCKIDENLKVYRKSLYDQFIAFSSENIDKQQFYCIMEQELGYKRHTKNRGLQYIGLYHPIASKQKRNVELKREYDRNYYTETVGLKNNKSLRSDLEFHTKIIANFGNDIILKTEILEISIIHNRYHKNLLTSKMERDWNEIINQVIKSYNENKLKLYRDTHRDFKNLHLQPRDLFSEHLQLIEKEYDTFPNYVKLLGKELNLTHWGVHTLWSRRLFIFKNNRDRNIDGGNAFKRRQIRWYDHEVKPYLDGGKDSDFGYHDVPTHRIGDIDFPLTVDANKKFLPEIQTIYLKRKNRQLTGKITGDKELKEKDISYHIRVYIDVVFGKLDPEYLRRCFIYKELQIKPKLKINILNNI